MNRKKINKTSKKREQQIAKEIGGKRHAGSGSVWWKKGDASNQDFLIEDKFTAKDYYTLSSRVLNKLEKQASAVNKLPVLKFGFNDTDNFAVLNCRDCVYSIENLITQYFKSMHVFYFNDLVSHFYILPNNFLRINMSDNSYLIMKWDYFLENKEKILKGELL